MASINDYTSSLNLLPIVTTGDFGSLIDAISKNFDIISSFGGGPMGPVGPQGSPGCRGAQGPPGLSISDDWNTTNSIGCNGSALFDISDVIMNNWVDKSLLLSNLVNSDSTIELRAPGSNE